MENRHWEIYTLTDPRTATVRYVGATFRAKRRFNEHISKAVKGGRTHRDCWIRSLIAQQVRPVYTVIERGTGDGWQEAEKRWITKYRETVDLTNRTDGGDGFPGYIPSQELREKWSAMRKGQPYAPGRVSAMLGKTHSEEAKAKIQASGAGRTCSAETRAKISAKHVGKKLSDEHRAKIGARRKGVPHTEEAIAKIAASTTGRKPILCIETGQVFPSRAAAARELGVNKSSITQATRDGGRCKGMHLQSITSKP